MAPGAERHDGIARALAVVGGLGGAGTLMTAAGGAITWIRFAEAKLPADQVVAVTPKNELVTVGAVALVGFAAVGLLAVLVAYLLDNCGTAGTRNKVSIVVLTLAGLAVAILTTEASTKRTIGALVVAALAALAAYLAAHRALERSKGEGAATRGGSIPRPVAIAIALVMAPAAVLLWLITGMPWIGVITVAAGVLGGGLLAVANATDDRFRWFGVSIFLAVLVFGAVMSLLRTASTTKLQSAAVALKESAGGGGLSGLFVAETADRVYVADVNHCKRDEDLKLVPTSQPIPGTGRIMAIPRTSVESLSIGTRQRLERAQERGPELLAELRTRTARGTVPQRQKVAAPHPCADEGVVDLTVRQVTEPSPARAARLARHYRPILRFDGRERWRPLDIAQLMAERTENGRPRHRVCATGDRGRQISCEPIGGVSDLSDDPSPDRVIDFDGVRANGSDRSAPSLERCPGRQAEHLLDCDGGPASAIYYRVTEANGRTYVDYWWFLRFNRFDKGELGRLCARPVQRALFGCFDHEGDWEGVTAVSARRNPTRLAFLNLASHEGVYRYTAAELALEGSRPRVYSARGSHASYPRRCARRCRQPHQLLPETNTDGSAPWARNSERACADGTCLIALPEGGFDAFGGRWGSRVCTKGCRLGIGPKTPAQQRRYQSPWCFTGPGRRLTCDGSPLITSGSGRPGAPSSPPQARR